MRGSRAVEKQGCGEAGLWGSRVVERLPPFYPRAMLAAACRVENLLRARNGRVPRDSPGPKAYKYYLCKRDSGSVTTIPLR